MKNKYNGSKMQNIGISYSIVTLEGMVLQRLQ